MEYWDWFLAQPDNYCLLRPDLKSAELFKKYVMVINLETSSYCNRRCSYCPMSLYPRHQKLMSPELWQSLLSQLKALDYSNWLTLNFFNEPLLDKTLASKIRELRAALPAATIFFNSNGDYLTRDLITTLAKAGLNFINVTLHPRPEESYSQEWAMAAMRDFLSKLKLEAFHDYVQREGTTLEIGMTFNDLKFRLNIRCVDWNSSGLDRGGTIAHLRAADRVSPCQMPFREIYISFDGLYKPCCNVYFGEGTTFGDARTTSLVDFFFSPLMTKFRASLLPFGAKGGWCRTCSQPDKSVPESAGRRLALLQKAGYELRISS